MPFSSTHIHLKLRIVGIIFLFWLGHCSSCFAGGYDSQKAEHFLQQAALYQNNQLSDSALLFYSKALQLLNKQHAEQYLKARNGMCIALIKLNAFANADRLLKQDKPFIVSRFGAESRQMIEYYYTLGRWYGDQKNTTKSMQCWQKAFRLAEKLYGAESPEAAIGNWKVSIYHKSADSSVYYSQRAVQILHRQRHPASVEDGPFFYNSLAGALHNLSYYNDNRPVTIFGRTYSTTLAASAVYYDSAVYLEKERYGKATGNTATFLHNQGVTYESMAYYAGSGQEERRHLLKALQLYEQSNDIAAPLGLRLVALNQVSKGMVYQQLGRQQEALQSYHAGIEAVIPHFRNAGLYQLPSVGNIYSSEYLSMLLEFKAKAFRELYRQNGKEKDLTGYYHYALKLIELLEHNRNSASFFRESGSEPDMDLLAENFGLGIEACYELYQKTQDKKYLHKAFEISQRFKNNTLLQVSNHRRLEQFLSGNSELQQRYGQQMRQFRIYDEQKELKVKYPALRQLFPRAEDSLETSNEQLRQLLVYLQKQHPLAYEHVVQKRYIFTADKLGQVLPDSMAIIEYVQHNEAMEETQTLYAFVVGKDFLELVRVPLQRNLQAAIDSLVQSIGRRNLQNYTSSAFGLYALAVQPVLEVLPAATREVVIMPDAGLWQVPFEALLTQQVPEKDYRKLPYLIRRLQISYGHSATLWGHKQQKHSAVTPVRVLAMAPFADEELAVEIEAGKVNLMSSSQGGSFSKLPYTIKLLNRLREQFRGTYLIDRHASEDFFKKNAADYGLIHLATHAEADMEDPLRSRFVLAEGKREDGMLYFSELIRLNLQPHLAVLSACETGVGKIEAVNEGMLSLSWSFRYLGCPSIVSTLWKVDDRYMSVVLGSFYDYLKQGQPKNAALHHAKLDLLKRAKVSEDAHPFFWSGIVLTGNTRPMLFEEPASKWRYYWAAGGLVLVMAGGAWWLRRRRK